MICSEIINWIVTLVMGLFVLCILAMVYFAGVVQGIKNVQEEITKMKELE